MLANGTRVYKVVRNESTNVLLDGVHCKDNYRQGLYVLYVRQACCPCV